MPMFSAFRLAYAAGSKRNPFTLCHMISLALSPPPLAYTPISTMSRNPDTHSRIIEVELSATSSPPCRSHAVPW